MPKITHPLLDWNIVRLLKGKFNVTSRSGDVTAGYSTGRNLTQAVIFLGEVDMKDDVQTQLAQLVMRNNLHTQDYDADGVDDRSVLRDELVGAIEFALSCKSEGRVAASEPDSYEKGQQRLVSALAKAKPRGPGELMIYTAPDPNQSLFHGE